ncbi:MAG TPA: type VI secretion system protein TssA [Bryobacteraceae bacterium]|nr:type VI secretion system protein TssA [Bryobacteraceae bacterium]
MPLRNDLLNPIPGDNPAGENLRYAPIFDKIKEARRQDDDAPQGEWTRERKVADYPLTIKLISETLATKSKDLQLVAWLTEAMLIREGIPGLKECLDLSHGLVENFWDGIYPELEDGDAEFRAAPLQWIGDRLEIPLRLSRVTKKGLSWLQYKEARAVGTEEAADTDAKREARQNAIAEGKVTQEDFDSDFDGTPKQFYADLVASYDTTLESLESLSSLCDGKFGDVAPSFSKLKSTLEEIRQTVKTLLQKKREKEPDAPAAAAGSEAESEPVEEAAPEPAGASAAAAAPARAKIKVAGGLSPEPANKEDAIARVIGAAKFLRSQDAYTPAPFLLLRGLRWGELRAAGSDIDQTMLAAPPTEIRQNLKKLSLESNWAELMEECESAMGMECGRGWLDLQRYVARACYEQGSYYEAIRQAVISSLRALLTDYPRLMEMTLMDDTATANGETQAWLKDEVLPKAAESAAQSAAFAPPPYAPPPSAPAEAGAPPDIFETAMNEARSGRAQQGIEILMREMTQERSGRARFQRKAQLAQLCAMTGHTPIAYPILQELAAEIERRKLEDWETPETLAQPLALLYKCMDKNASPEDRQKLYSWICRLDPLAALTVNK